MEQEIKDLNKARECHGKKIAILEKECTYVKERMTQQGVTLNRIWYTILGLGIASLAERLWLGV